jgi:hypothetical protein
MLYETKSSKKKCADLFDQVVSFGRGSEVDAKKKSKSYNRQELRTEIQNLKSKRKPKIENRYK